MADAAASTAVSPSLTKPIVTPKTWNAVAVWNYESRYDICSICKQNINDLCIDCQSQMAGNVACSVAWGTCNHAYHNHCLQGWLKGHATCPMCQAPWETERVS